MEVTAPVDNVRTRPAFASWRGIWRCWAGATAELFPAEIELALERAAVSGWRLDSEDSFCHRCGGTCGPHASTPDGFAVCDGQPLQWDRAVRLGPYREPLSRWILDMKFSGRWYWAKWMGQQLASLATEPLRGRSAVVCPVPMPWQRRIRRGYNQSALIADAFATRLGWPVVPLLRRTGYAPPQFVLSASNRIGNVRSMFATRPVDLSRWEVWLVDDVKTTGSTLSVCARHLRRAGAARVNVAVVAVA